LNSIYRDQNSSISADLWRQNLARTLIRALAIFGVLTVAFAVYTAIVGDILWQIPIRVGVYIPILVLAFSKRIPYQVQAAVIIITFSAFGIFNHTQFGFDGESALFLLSSVLLAALFFGPRVGAIAMALTCLAILVLAWGFTSGRIVAFFPNTQVPRSTGWPSWLLYLGVFLGLGAGIQYAQGYLLKHLAVALDRSYELTRDLNAERSGLAEQVMVRTQAAEQARYEAEIAAAALQEKMWLITGQAQLSAVLRGEHDLTSLAQAVIAEVCRYVEASAGALYLCDDDAVCLSGCYAYTTTTVGSECFRLGEGLVGQAAKENRMLALKDIPDSQFLLASGLGQTMLRHLLIAPFAYLGGVSGVLELGFAQAFTESQMQFVEQSLEPIAIAFNSARNRTHIKALLEETRRQASALAVREEELRAVNDQLQVQADGRA